METVHVIIYTFIGRKIEKLCCYYSEDVFVTLLNTLLHSFFPQVSHVHLFKEIVITGEVLNGKKCTLGILLQYLKPVSLYFQSSPLPDIWLGFAHIKHSQKKRC